MVALFQLYARHKADLMCIEFAFSKVIKALRHSVVYVNLWVGFFRSISIELVPLLCEWNIYFLLLKEWRHDGFQLEGETFLWEWARLITYCKVFHYFSFHFCLQFTCMWVWQYSQPGSEFLWAFWVLSKRCWRSCG